ncbi:hypothetical protein ACTXT7_002751 [Hymenolepis weldensis]
MTNGPILLFFPLGLWLCVTAYTAAKPNKLAKIAALIRVVDFKTKSLGRRIIMASSLKEYLGFTWTRFQSTKFCVPSIDMMEFLHAMSRICMNNVQEYLRRITAKRSKSYYVYSGDSV